MRADALHQGIHRYNQHTTLHRGQLVERGETGGDNFLMRRETVIRQCLPVSKIHHQVVGKLGNFVMQTQGILHIRRNQYHRTFMALNDFRDFGGAGCASQFAKLALLASFGGQRITVLFRHR
jgi:hypothetical protein